MKPIETDLSKVSILKTEKDIIKFENIILSLSKIKDPEVIELIIKGLNDKSEHPEVTFAAIHAIERYDVEDYIPQIIKSSEEMIQRCSYWYKIIIYRIFNSDVYYTLYKKLLEKTVIYNIKEFKTFINSIKEESPKFNQQCNEILKILEIKK